jgi:hypothetical protein
MEASNGCPGDTALEFVKRFVFAVGPIRALARQPTSPRTRFSAPDHRWATEHPLS